MATCDAVARGDCAGVRVCPPRVYAGALAFGGALELAWPLASIPVPSWVGLALIAAGLLFAAWALWTLDRQSTTHGIHEPTERIVVDGPFRYSRNPVYLSGTVLCFGIAVVFSSMWLVILAAAATGIVRFDAISREEDYLDQKFGAVYGTYRRRVRRWL